MRRTESEESQRAEFSDMAQGMHRRLHGWRQTNPDATFDEIAEHVSQERKLLMGHLLGELATATDRGGLDPSCPTCGEALQNKGVKKRGVLHREGETKLVRNHFYCPACKQGFFPSALKNSPGIVYRKRLR